MPARDLWHRTWQTSARSDPRLGSSSSSKTLHQNIVFGDTVLRFNSVPACYSCAISLVFQNAANAIKFHRGRTDARPFHIR